MKYASWIQYLNSRKKDSKNSINNPDDRFGDRLDWKVTRDTIECLSDTISHSANTCSLRGARPLFANSSKSKVVWYRKFINDAWQPSDTDTSCLISVTDSIVGIGSLACARFPLRKWLLPYRWNFRHSIFPPIPENRLRGKARGIWKRNRFGGLKRRNEMT